MEFPIWQLSFSFIYSDGRRKESLTLSRLKISFRHTCNIIILWTLPTTLLFASISNLFVYLAILEWSGSELHDSTDIIKKQKKYCITIKTSVYTINCLFSTCPGQVMQVSLSKWSLPRRQNENAKLNYYVGLLTGEFHRIHN